MNPTVHNTGVSFTVDDLRITLSFYELSQLLAKVGNSLSSSVATTSRSLLTCSALVRLIDSRVLKGANANGS